MILFVAGCPEPTGQGLKGKAVKIGRGRAAVTGDECCKMPLS